MGVQIAHGGEAFRALVASIRLLACVKSHVNDEMSAVCKLRLTYVTLMMLFAGVSFLVHTQAVRVGESLTAFVALVWLFSSMRSFVNINVSGSGEALMTYVAFEGFVCRANSPLGTSALVVS